MELIITYFKVSDTLTVSLQIAEAGQSALLCTLGVTRATSLVLTF